MTRRFFGVACAAFAEAQSKGFAAINQGTAPGLPRGCFVATATVMEIYTSAKIVWNPNTENNVGTPCAGSKTHGSTTWDFTECVTVNWASTASTSAGCAVGKFCWSDYTCNDEAVSK